MHKLHIFIDNLSTNTVPGRHIHTDVMQDY